MARSKLMAGILSTVLLIAGTVFHNALNFVEHSPTMLYLAGQFKMATGDTNAALDLIGRAATAGHSGGTPVPANRVATPKPEDKATPSVCTVRAVSKEQPKTRVNVVAKASSPGVTVAALSEPTDQVLMVGFSPHKFRVPFDPAREFAKEQQMLARVYRQQAALAMLEHLRVRSYTSVMQTMPRVRVVVPKALPMVPQRS